MKIRIYKDTKTTFTELRYTKEVQNCEKLHTHETLTITAIEYGIQEIFNRNDRNTISKGKIAVINPNESHYGKNIGTKNYGGYVLYIDIAFCKKLQLELFEEIEEFVQVDSNIIDNLELYEEFLDMCKLLLSETYLIEKEIALIDFMYKIFLNYCNTSKIKLELETKSEVQYAKRIQDYLDENYLKDITLNDIASVIKLSHFYLLKVFKNKFGIPPHSYLLNKRVHRAKELLTNKMPIAEIAVESGFFDQSHLTRSFKRVFSITPKEYQDNLSFK